MGFSYRAGMGSGNVDVLKCDDLSASRAVGLKNRMNRLMNRNHFRLVVDMEQARRTDAAGIGILVEKLIRIREHHGDIRLCSLRPEVSRTMERVGAGSLFETYHSREEALKNFRGF